jgi:antitoxin (DNA-binding transcriptional repressor) of toxin-antitoxin stability system
MTVTLTQAQADLVGLIRRLSPGDQLFITENDRTIAILTTVPQSPPGGLRPPPGLLKGGDRHPQRRRRTPEGVRGVHAVRLLLDTHAFLW